MIRCTGRVPQLGKGRNVIKIEFRGMGTGNIFQFWRHIDCWNVNHNFMTGMGQTNMSQMPHLFAPNPSTAFTHKWAASHQQRRDFTYHRGCQLRFGTDDVFFWKPGQMWRWLARMVGSQVWGKDYRKREDDFEKVVRKTALRSDLLVGFGQNASVDWVFGWIGTIGLNRSWLTGQLFHFGCVWGSAAARCLILRSWSSKVTYKNAEHGAPHHSGFSSGSWCFEKGFNVALDECETVRDSFLSFRACFCYEFSRK